MATEFLQVWPQEQPVAVVAYGPRRKLSLGDYRLGEVTLTNPGDLLRYAERLHMPQDRDSTARV